MDRSEAVLLVETAYAKINLALHVRHRRADGYHALETLFAFAYEGDELTVRAADQLSLSIGGRFGAGLSHGADNLVMRAATALRSAFGTEAGAALHLDKRLPVAAGIGGGSADAAAAIRLLVRHWQLEANPAQLHAIATALGADVPACLLSQSCFGTGIGDDLEPLDNAGVGGTPILLVNPLLACPTGPVFAAWDGVDRGSLDPTAWKGARNDLQAPAVQLLPVIADVLAALAQTGAVLTRMSGSGATCFALFDEAETRDAAAKTLQDAHPDWWLSQTTLRP